MLRLHRHQREAIEAARTGDSYVLTTGTGSGKSLAYIVPIVDRVLAAKAAGTYRRGIKAIVVYPMNALANSQLGELGKFLTVGYPDGPPVTFARYTGQESPRTGPGSSPNPPDILLTNYVMLELVLTRPRERGLIDGGAGAAVPGPGRAAHLPRPAGRGRRAAGPPAAGDLRAARRPVRRHLGDDDDAKASR